MANLKNTIVNGVLRVLGKVKADSIDVKSITNNKTINGEKINITSEGQMNLLSNQTSGSDSKITMLGNEIRIGKFRDGTNGYAINWNYDSLKLFDIDSDDTRYAFNKDEAIFAKDIHMTKYGCRIRWHSDTATESDKCTELDDDHIQSACIQTEEISPRNDLDFHSIRIRGAYSNYNTYIEVQGEDSKINVCANSDNYIKLTTSQLDMRTPKVKLGYFNGSNCIDASTSKVKIRYDGTRNITMDPNGIKLIGDTKFVDVSGGSTTITTDNGYTQDDIDFLNNNSLQEILVNNKRNIKVKTFIKNNVDGDINSIDLGYNNTIYSPFSTCEGYGNTVGTDVPFNIEWKVINAKIISNTLINGVYQYEITNPQNVESLPLSNGTYNLVIRGCVNENNLIKPSSATSRYVQQVTINSDTITVTTDYNFSNDSRIDLYYGNNSSNILNGYSGNGSYSHAEGNDTKAIGNYSHTEGASTKAIGNYSHAEGAGTTANGDYSHAEGAGTTANGNYSHAEGASTTANGSYSHAEGNATTASDISHAEGIRTVSSNDGSHAEGNTTTANNGSHAEGISTKAIGNYSHAEGAGTTANSDYSHAEGASTTANGNYSHAEGGGTKAIGNYSHAEGASTTANGTCSHAEGLSTTANGNYSHTQGKYNKKLTDCTDETLKTGDAMAIGNGTSSTDLSNAFRVTFAGQVYGLSAFNSTGADYGEYFEWEDGNLNNEDRVGFFVTLNGKKIKKANNDDYILGVISGQPCIIGNSDEDWQGRWLHDDFGRFLKREITTEITKTVIETNENGTMVEKEIPTGEFTTGWDYVPNPDYDQAKDYIPREERPEWSVVGMLGVLSVYDDGSCEVNGYAKCGSNGIATKSDSKSDYRVIARKSDNIIEIILK